MLFETNLFHHNHNLSLADVFTPQGEVCFNWRNGVSRWREPREIPPVTLPYVRIQDLVMEDLR